ncbi:hypothetical protein M2366_001883 [Aeromonas sp. BIGb0405]|uniref:hypothetical protein n=1 Tax=Aeromonas sp. BIGb0405 TaxID=2940592 RepID=UPI00216A34B6|nr:hypothetical protein [Aeromonas sp. BIGb0405]MCS3455802.1 hypothetical protein [Aeromonas sp. BIGb0405]
MNEQHTDNLSLLQGEALRSYISDSYRELEKEPVLHQWDISHKNPHRWLVSGIVFFIFIVLAYVTGTTGEYGANTSLWFFSLFAVFGGGYVRFLLLPDNIYNYHLTSKGICYTQQDSIPDIAFTIARGLGWFGCGVCVLAAGMLGPAAFIGAGASALLAWKIKDMKPKQIKDIALFSSRHGVMKVFKAKECINLFFERCTRVYQYILPSRRV